MKKYDTCVTYGVYYFGIIIYKYEIINYQIDLSKSYRLRSKVKKTLIINSLLCLLCSDETSFVNNLSVWFNQTCTDSKDVTCT